MANSTDTAADIDAIRQTLAGIGLDDTSQGAAADAIRKALAEHGATLDTIANAARAVRQAARDREALITERDAQMPSEAEIYQAQEEVITAAAAAAAGTGSADAVAKATERLTELLARKQAAHDKFHRGEQESSAALDHAVSDLPAHPPGAGAGGVAPLSQALSALSKFKLPTIPGAAMQAGADAPPAPGADMSPSDIADLLDSPDSDPSLGGRVAGPLTDPAWADGAGQMHTSADEIPQIPTIAGVHTAADISGMPASPFTVTPPTSTAAPASGTGMGGMPMMPPMTPSAGSGGASGRAKANKSIINTDPDFTGTDIDVQIATSGVVGRGEQRNR